MPFFASSASSSKFLPFNAFLFTLPKDYTKYYNNKGDEREIS